MGQNGFIAGITKIASLFAVFLHLHSIIAADAALPPDTTKLAEASNRFTSEILQPLSSGDGNIFVSAFSIRMALAMVTEGAASATREQIDHVLGFETPESPGVFGRFGEALTSKMSQSNINVALGNGIWIEAKYPVLDGFTEALETNFHAKATPADFSTHPEVEREAINAWVSEETHAKIPELFQAGDINTSTRMVLANAIYFKSDWSIPFPKADTQDGTFLNADGSRATVSLMHLTGDFLYSEDADYQVLQLDYDGGRASMLVVLPQSPKNLSIPENQLLDLFSSQKMASSKVAIVLPKFSLKIRLGLGELLQRLGMPDAFDATKADFSKITANKDLSISAVVHEAFLEVDESGTEAAAATGVVMRMTMMVDDESIPFIADRPFWFFIKDNHTGTILFSGRLASMSE